MVENTHPNAVPALQADTGTSHWRGALKGVLFQNHRTPSDELDCAAGKRRPHFKSLSSTGPSWLTEGRPSWCRVVEPAWTAQALPCSPRGAPLHWLVATGLLSTVGSGTSLTLCIDTRRRAEQKDIGGGEDNLKHGKDKWRRRNSFGFPPQT